MKSLNRTLIAFIVSVLLTALVFYNVVGNLNNDLFTQSGDGLRGYYVALFHTNFDHQVWQTQAMNYPYGESLFFTDSMPLVSNFVNLFSHVFFDITPYTVGIFNLSILLGILFGIFFIYLILRKLNLPFLYSLVVAVGIAFLSPQIGRINGHFSLSFIVFIPLFIYLLMIYNEKRNTRSLLYFSGAVFFSLFFHIYYIGFVAFLLFFYWLFRFLSESEKPKIGLFIFHFITQLVLPLVLMQLFINWSSEASDRTQHPWGFFSYRANPATVFLPLNKPYFKFLNEIKWLQNFNWEGFSYIGMVAAVVFIYGAVIFFREKNYKLLFKTTGDSIIVPVLLSSGIAAMLFSFGVPFIFGLKKLVSILGPLEQLRSIGRFAWLFYYCVNIWAFWFLYNKVNQLSIRNWFKNGILVLFAGVLFFEAYNTVKYVPDAVGGKPNVFFSKESGSKMQKDYQAILTVPHFHVGSENVWIDGGCNAFYHSFVVAVKYGIPLHCVLSGRASLSQTFDNIDLYSDTYKSFKQENQFLNHNPFLVLKLNNCESISDPERDILNAGVLVDSTADYNLYEISYENLVNIPETRKGKVKKEMPENVPDMAGDFLSFSDSLGFLFNGYENTPSDNSFVGNGCYAGPLKDYNRIFEGKLSPNDSGEYVVSFWVYNFKKDLMMRTGLEITVVDSTDKVYDYQLFQLFHKLIAFSGDWVLIEHKVLLKQPSDILKVTLWNSSLEKDKLKVDNLLIRKAHKNVFLKSDENRLYFNNRKIFLEN